MLPSQANVCQHNCASDKSPSPACLHPGLCTRVGQCVCFIDHRLGVMLPRLDRRRLGEVVPVL